MSNCTTDLSTTKAGIDNEEHKQQRLGMDQTNKIIRRKPAIDTRIERQIVTGLIVSDEFCKQILPSYTPNSLRGDFTNTIAGWCIEYYKRYKKPPGRNIQDIFVEHRKADLDPGRAEIIEEFLSSISHEYETGDGFNVAYVADKTQEHFRLSQIEVHRLELSRCISSGRIQDAEKLISDFKPININDAVIENIRQGIQDVKKIFITSKPYVENLQLILGADSRIITIPDRAQKGFGEIFEGKEVAIILPKENLNSTEQFGNEVKENAKSLTLVSFPVDSERFETLQGKRKKLFLRHSNEILHRRIDKATDLAQTTLRKALDTMTIPFDQLEKQDLPKRKKLLPWLNESDVVMISGDSGVGKTWFVMELCAAIQNGRPAMGGLWEVGNPAKCLIVDGEMHWEDIWQMGLGLRLGKVDILSRMLMDRREVIPSLNLAEADARNLLFNHIVERNYKLVVLDNLFSLFFGDDLDKAMDWQGPNQWLLKLRSAGICVILLHHTNKAGDQIGTKSRTYNLNTHLLLTAVKPQKVNEKGERLVSFKIKPEKQRSKGFGFGNMVFSCDDGVWTVTESGANGEGVGKQDLIMALVIDNKLSGKDIAEKVGCGRSYVSQVRNKTRAKGYLKNNKPTPSGLEFLQSIALDEFYAGDIHKNV